MTWLKICKLERCQLNQHKNIFSITFSLRDVSPAKGVETIILHSFRSESQFLKRQVKLSHRNGCNLNNIYGSCRSWRRSWFLRVSGRPQVGYQDVRKLERKRNGVSALHESPFHDSVRVLPVCHNKSKVSFASVQLHSKRA